MIKAIETEYNGYRFRSRLEARWAVFFDTLGIEYEYEKEGYELESGWYLPDFWLPELDMWVEVKGQELNEDEKRKCNELALKTDKRVAVVFGDIQPFDIEYKNDVFETKGDNELFLSFTDRENNLSCWVHGCSFKTCGICGDIFYYIQGDWCEDCVEWYNKRCDSKKVHAQETKIKDAYKKARSARFEHGEKP